MRFFPLLSNNLKRAGLVHTAAGFMLKYIKGPVGDAALKLVGSGCVNFGIAMAGVGIAMDFYQQRRYSLSILFTFGSTGFLFLSIFSPVVSGVAAETEALATTGSGSPRLKRM